MAKPMKLISQAEYDKLIEQSSKKVPLVGKDASYFLQNQKAKKILDSKNLPDDIKLQLFSTAMKDATDNLLKLLSKPVRVDSIATKRPSNKIAKIHKINDEAETSPVLNLPEEIDEIIVSKLAKSIQGRGKVILHHLRTTNDIIS